MQIAWKNNGLENHCKMENVHIYTRKNLASAWKYERTTNLEAAKLARDVNVGFGLETLLVPAVFPCSEWLDSYQSQSDFLLEV